MPNDVSRRRFIVHAAQGTLWAVSSSTLSGVAHAMQQTAALLPSSIAGISIPDTPLAKAAIAIARINSPPLLFNHSMRVFVFGALIAKHDSVAFDDELLMTAAAFHDLGMLEKYSSPNQPFEMDSADAAKAFLVEHGVDEARAEQVWNMVALHATAFPKHYPGPIRLIANGASVDFFGAFAAKIPPEQRELVVQALPRLGFKAGIQNLLIDYCRRKPRAQVGTWTDVFCRSHTEGIEYPTIPDLLVKSPYRE